MARPVGRLLGRLLVIVALGAANLFPGAPGAAAHVEVAFGTLAHDVRFAQSITFEQPVTLAAPAAVRRVELLLRFQGEAGARVFGVQEGGTLQTGTLRHVYSVTDDHIYPNTGLQARFRIVAPDGHATLGPEVALRYRDERFDWRTVEGGIVRVHWYEGSADFGRRALAIAEAGVDKSQRLLGVTETEPVDFWIYADVDDFYDALGPGSRENVGGFALAHIRTLFALVPPDEIDDAWVASVVPHELSHLVFDTAVKNPYHGPPRWLDEGLAVYDSDGYDLDRRGRVNRAVRDGVVIPLVGLAGFFPTTFEKFALAYAESVSAVDFFVRRFGREALVELIRSYAGGITDDEAFRAAIGTDVAGFDALWLEEIGASEPTRYGPRPAPAGPLPPGWTLTREAPAPSPTPIATAVTTVPPAATRTAAASAAPTATVVPSPTRVAVASAAASAAATSAPTAGGGEAAPASASGLDNQTLGLLLGLLAIGLAVVGVGLIVNGRRRPASP